MESILFIALSIIKEFAYYIIITALAFLCAVIVFTFLIQVIARKKVNLKRYNLLFIISAIAYFNGMLIDIFIYRKVFLSFIDVILGVSVIAIVGLLGNVVLSLFKFKKKIPISEYAKVSIPREDVKKSVEVLSCIEEPVSVYGGYIDVKYLKGLIDKIKERELSFDDEREIDELEVYLLNFVNRQPNAYERKKLSEFVESLIKKLAKYNVN